MIILGIETSCDETAAAVLQKTEDRIQILSNVVASSAALQVKYGGVIPEQAAREQIKSIIPVIEEALSQAFPNYKLQATSYQLIDAIAVTYGPGLIGSLLVGIETAKTLAKIYNKPLIPINHLIGHFYANWISQNQGSRIKNYGKDKKPLILNTYPPFPCIGLLVSGGHTDLVLFTDHNKYEYLGGTRDDAAGECFDKCARLLGLPYPGGPSISNLAKSGKSDIFKLPIPMRQSHDLDFSYSGLKTAVASLVKTLPVIASEAKQSSSENEIASSKTPRNDSMVADLAAAIEDTIVKSLILKLTQALKKHPVKDILVAGGVAANEKLAESLQSIADKLGVKLHIPPPDLCTDNGAMIASAGFFYKPTDHIFSIEADPNLALSD